MALDRVNYRHGDWRVKARRGIVRDVCAAIPLRGRRGQAPMATSDVSTLVRADLPPSVRLEEDEGRLPRLSIRNAQGAAEVCFQGAQITSWHPAGSRERVLWLSRESLFEPGKPIRGGVPICFPWFSKLRSAPTAPPHGFARTTAWTLIGAREDAAGTVTLEMELAGDAVSPHWPHRFQARCRIGIGAALRLDLDVLNRGDAPFTYEEALHAYFDVHDIRNVSLTGLEDAAFIDKAAGAGREAPGSGPLRFAGQTNRVYADTRAACVIHDPDRHRDIVVGKSGSDSTVVWNPWADRAREMTDFADDEWPGMVCVEPCNVGVSARTLGPGESHTMTVTIEPRESRPAARESRS
jgi:glucose-6-phosphate 1-epimerase